MDQGRVWRRAREGQRVRELLTPKQVARAIGVSESSLKRWCDQGLLPSVQRTAGGRRRLALRDVLHFVRAHDHPLVAPEALGLTATSQLAERGLARGMELATAALLAGMRDCAARCCSTCIWPAIR